MNKAELTPEMMLRAYAMGIFPMAERRDDPQLNWVDPKRRGIIPVDQFHISRSLRRRILAEPFEIRFDTAFQAVVLGCANREETWINDTILRLCLDLHRAGHAHSAEVWDGAELVGGVYGLSLGAAFFGESMFSSRTDASKIALAYLIDRLRAGGFILFDTQFLTPHLQSLGALEISRAEYHGLLRSALLRHADFDAQSEVPSAAGVVQRSTQTS